MIEIHPPETFSQSLLGGEHVGIQMKEIPSVPVLPGARRCDDVRWPGQHRSSNRSQDFIKRDIDRIKQLRDLRVLPLVKRLAFPESGTIEMGGNAALACPLDDLAQRFPTGQLPTQFALG